MSSGASIARTASSDRGGLRFGGPLAVAFLLASLWLSFPARAGAVVQSGALSQLPSPNECVGGIEEQETISGALCLTSVPYGLHTSYQVQVSPDGGNAYSVAGQGDLIEYSRNPANGALTVIGCFTSLPNSNPPCASANANMGVIAVNSPGAIALSPDGANAYVLSQGANNDLVEFSRDPETGLLTKMGCITEEASSSECATTGAKGLNLPFGVTVSPDGENVYVASYTDEAVAEFSRETKTGALTQLASPNDCISATASSGCGTTTAIGLKAAIGVVVSPDNKNLYVAAGAKGEEGDIAAFKRGSEGALEQLSGEKGCISELVVGCAKGKEVTGSEDLVISPDGKNVYANAFEHSAVVELEREAATGVLTQLAKPNACIMTAPAVPVCTEAEGIKGPIGVAISPGGESLYVSSFEKNTEAAFKREAGGGLKQLEKPYECVTTELAGCGLNGLIGLSAARRVTVSPDGTNVYVAGQSSSAIVELARTVKPTAEPVSPGEGCDACETSVTIKGTGFAEGAQVKFGATPAVSVTVNSATSISALSPVGVAGPVLVTVSNTAGEAAAGEFEYTKAKAPTVSAVGPHWGAEAGGEVVSISGTEFLAEGTTVAFAGRPAMKVTVNAGNSITATNPTGSGEVEVTVTTAKGTSNATKFTYDFVPPHRLGGLNTTGYCEGLGYHGTKGEPAKLTRPGVEKVEGPGYAIENWACEDGIGNLVIIKSAGPPPSENDMCRVEYPGKASFAYAEEINSAFSWDCYESPPSIETPAEKPKATIATTPPPEGIPPPVLAKTGNVAPVSGRVLVQLPGTHTFVPLASLRQIPFGTIIDATHGRVSVTTAGPHGGTQTGEFFQGEFVLTQGRSGLVVATLNGGDFSVCPTARERAHRARASARHASGKHAVRKLWANAHGSFSTKGNYAAGAVQGTEWLTEDLCEGTLIRVTRDKVKVTDLVRHRSLTVKAGRRYLAKAP